MTTIQEIAARTGISASAAAQVLSYDPTLAIGEDIRRRVFEAASGSARSGQWPRRAPIGRIGLLGRTSRAARQADRWRSALLTGVERACRARGMECVSLVGLPDKAARPEVLDGIVAVDRLDAEELARLRARGLPAVFVGASPDDVAYDSVVIDYREAVERLIAHWRGRGFRRFAYIGACDAERDAAGQADRFYALRSGLGRHDASGLQLLRANRTEQAEEGRRLMAEALACREAPAAVVVENEELAEGGSGDFAGVRPAHARGCAAHLAG
ncbi:hypothetical protein OMP38_09305 [Cohnella ginsengisoli]|uniref:LacI family transcriptional regulator n=1 Tax=Cohnella ginsengisoli TaxID=425004 RepID=A0A9X4KFW3_9BACL|nr:hypothetical protein [Cohnella ginsengisoli]MDG0791041.1 hypothetical protein [Cohnella ginsengisoli]